MSFRRPQPDGGFYEILREVFLLLLSKIEVSLDKERLKNQDVYWLKLCNHYDCTANEREESNLKKSRFSLFWKVENSFIGQWSLRKGLHYNELDSVILEY